MKTSGIRRSKSPWFCLERIKVKVRVSGICGSDVPRVLHNGVHFYPIVLGHEFSGDVVEVGEGVKSVRQGDRVSGRSAFALHAVRGLPKR